jgi:hypothetical protein
MILIETRNQLIELVHRICKDQFSLAKLGLKDTAAPAIWEAVLSA